MSQDVNQDWANRDFIESVEVAIRKCVEFLNDFHESAKYRLSEVESRITSLERKLDFVDAQLANTNPAQRNGQPKPFKGSSFDPEVRRQQVKKFRERFQKKEKVFSDRIIAPKKTDVNKVIVNSKKMAPKQEILGAPKSQGGGNIPIAQAQQQAKARQLQQLNESKDNGPGSNGPGNASAGPGSAPGANRPPPNAAQAQAAMKQQQQAQQQQQQQKQAQAQAQAKAQAQAQQQAKPPPAVPAVPPVPKVPANNGGGGDDGEGEGGGFPHGNPNAIDILLMRPGKGQIPGPKSQVRIEYKGYLADGSMFIQHEETIALGLKQNIKGLEEGIQKMKEGSTVKLWIPSKLGYGARGAPPLIPQNADLTFELTLHELVG